MSCQSPAQRPQRDLLTLPAKIREIALPAAFGLDPFSPSSGQRLTLRAASFVNKGRHLTNVPAGQVQPESLHGQHPARDFCSGRAPPERDPLHEVVVFW